MIIPTSTNIDSDRVPYANYALIILMLVSYVLQVWFDPEFVGIEKFLYVHTWLKFPVQIFIHLGFIHLISNLIALWVFGNVVCSKLGNKLYFFIFIILGILAHIAYFKLFGRQAVGASAAINIIFGIFIYLYPFKRLKFLYFFIIANGKFQLQSLWVGLFWLYGNVSGLFQEHAHIAYRAHFIGIILGVFIAQILLKQRIITLNPGDKTILSMPENLHSIDFTRQRARRGIFALSAVFIFIGGLATAYMNLRTYSEYMPHPYYIGFYDTFIDPQHALFYVILITSFLVLFSLVFRKISLYLLLAGICITLVGNLLLHTPLNLGLGRFIILLIFLEIHEEEKFWPKLI